MKTKEFEDFINTNYPSQISVLFSQLPKDIFQTILYEINQCSLMYYNQFHLNPYLDSFNQYDLVNDIEKQENLMSNIIYIINHLLTKNKSDKKQNNQLIY